MKTISIQIGNSDNKLTQQEWGKFVREVNGAIEAHAAAVHFFGGPSNWSPWQNVAWVIECAEYMIPSLKDYLAKTKVAHQQDSIAYLEGEGLFI